MTNPWPAGHPPFRAGGPGGAHTARRFFTPAELAALTRIGDMSEFQPAIDDAAYVNQFSKAAIFRGMYGADHIDKAWFGGARRSAFWDAGARVVMMYQYIVAAQDPAVQAHAFADLVGDLAPGEWLIGDLEEGAGSQAARRSAWQGVIAARYPWMAKTPAGHPWMYSGLFFAGQAGIAPVDWLADYTPVEPGSPHTLWQFTDSARIPGVGVADCSLYHGTVEDLRALFTPAAKPTPKPQPAAGGDRQMIASGTLTPGTPLTASFPGGAVKSVTFLNGTQTGVEVSYRWHHNTNNNWFPKLADMPLTVQVPASGDATVEADDMSDVSGAWLDATGSDVAFHTNDNT